MSAQTLHADTPTQHTSRTLKTAQRTSGGAAYASAEQLAKLAQHLRLLNDATHETGWVTPSMIASFGEGDESIVVGIRWVGDAYFAEIR